MYAKTLAGLVVGIVAAGLCSIFTGVAAGDAVSGGATGTWAAVASFVAVLLLVITAATGRAAWGRGLLILGFLCLLMAIAMGYALHAGEVASRARQADRVGAAIVAVMAGTLLAEVVTVIGFMIGLILLIGSYFALRKT